MEKVKPIIADTSLIAACGLYCGACRKYRVDKCPGCRENEKASWCGIRKCVGEKGFHTCAQCEKDIKECKTYSNFMSKIFSFIFRSDRPACISYIRENGEQAFAEEMVSRGSQTFKRK